MIVYVGRKQEGMEGLEVVLFGFYFALPAFIIGFLKVSYDLFLLWKNKLPMKEEFLSFILTIILIFSFLFFLWHYF